MAVVHDDSGIEGTVILGSTAAAIGLARRRGLDPRPLFEVTGLAPSSLSDPDLRIPVTAGFTVLAHIARSLREPSLPIQLAEATRMEHLHLIGFLIMTSSTGREAFERMVRYSMLVTNSSRWVLDVNERSARLEFVREGPRTLGHRLTNELVLANVVHGIRMVSGLPTGAAAVWFRHRAPADTSAHAAFFQAPIAWASSADALELPLAVLEGAPRNANSELSAYLERQAQERLKALGNIASLAAEVREAIVRELPSGVPNMQRVARRLGTSERTLRRHLEQEGTSFRAQVDAVRKDRARELLSTPDIGLTDAAFMLGFSDASAFSRAFRRWFDQSPRAYRDSSTSS